MPFWPIRHLLALTLVSFPLAGCGSDSEPEPSQGIDSQSPSAPTSPTSPALPTAQTQPMTSALRGKLLFEAPWHTAELDLASGRETYLPLSGLADVSADGSELLFSYYRFQNVDDYGNVLSISDRRGVVSNTIGTWEKVLHNVRFSPDRTQIAALVGVPPAPLIVMPRSGVSDVDVAYDVDSFAFMPDGRILLVYKEALLFLDIRTGKLSALTSFPGQNPQSLAVSPDGKRVALTLGDGELLEDQVYVLDLLPNGLASTPRQLTIGGIGDNNSTPAWSPDGTLIAVRHGVTSGGVGIVSGTCPTLYVVDANLTAPIRTGLAGTARAIPMHDDTGFSRNEACAFSGMHWR